MFSNEKKLGTGRQEFSLFTKENLIYVDKTKDIYELVNSDKYYFLSRPRRFGKSLLLNTIKELFKGKKEYFKDTWIYDKWNWNKSNPIIKISLAGAGYGSLTIEEALFRIVNEIAGDNNIKLSEDVFDKAFRELIKKMGQETPVVILIDEYDKPIIDYLEKKSLETAYRNREVLKRFYSVVKDSDEYIRLLFITGVSKFSRVSFFSELNNLTDITIGSRYSGITGYTQEDIVKYYLPWLKKIMDKYSITMERLLELMKLWYDGYSWDGENFVYNPYSVLLFLNSQRFDNFWFKTGTPTFLTKMMKERDVDLSQYENFAFMEAYMFDSYEIESIDIDVLLFQAGYLTIKEAKVNQEYLNTSYKLGFPNFEVKESLYHFLLGEYSGVPKTSILEITTRLKRFLENHDLENFFEDLHVLFSRIPHTIFISEREGYYHSIIYLLLKIMKVDMVKAERMINKGRIDAVITTDRYIYVFEFKMEDVNSAMKQIRKLKYYESYLNDNREIVLVAVAFGKKERNIKKYLVEMI